MALRAWRVEDGRPVRAGSLAIGLEKHLEGWIEADPSLVADGLQMVGRQVTLSGGRLDLGIGFGWNVEEMADHGVAFKERRAVVREKVLAMKALWTQDEAGFSGEHVRFEPSWSWPKPVQKPHPPLLIGGGGGPKLFEAIADYADGWIPIGGAGLREALPALRRAMESAGRDPAELSIVPFGSLPDPGKVEYYRSLGVSEIVFRVPPVPADEALPVLDQIRATLDLV